MNNIFTSSDNTPSGALETSISDLTSQIKGDTKKPEPAEPKANLEEEQDDDKVV